MQAAVAPNAGPASADGNAAETADHGKGGRAGGQWAHNALLGICNDQAIFLSRPPVICKMRPDPLTTAGTGGLPDDGDKASPAPPARAADGLTPRA